MLQHLLFILSAIYLKMKDQPVNFILRRTHIKKIRSRKLFSKINRSTHICDTYLRKGKKIFRKWKIKRSDEASKNHCFNHERAVEKNCKKIRQGL